MKIGELFVGDEDWLVVELRGGPMVSYVIVGSEWRKPDGSVTRWQDAGVSFNVDKLDEMIALLTKARAAASKEVG